MGEPPQLMMFSCHSDQSTCKYMYMCMIAYSALIKGVILISKMVLYISLVCVAGIPLKGKLKTSFVCVPCVVIWYGFCLPLSRCMFASSKLL